MTSALWQHDGTEWKLTAPEGFPDEAALHRLVEDAPQVLPLSGSPTLVVVGREVALAGGYADLMALEPGGRIVLIEVKLSRNADARRAVVAQILSYAAALRGMDASVLESDILLDHLRSRGYASLSDAVAANDQEASFDAPTFAEGLAESLRRGGFRLVLVLDEAPPDLVRLVGYLESVTEGLVIDLVTVANYEFGGSMVLVPQRVDPEHLGLEPPRATPRPPDTSRVTRGAADFRASIDSAPEENRELLTRLCSWAEDLEREGLVTLATRHDKRGWKILLPKLRPDNVGLVTIWNDGRGTMSLWRSVFERRASSSLEAIEELIAPQSLGGTISDLSEELFEALTEAHREAASSRPERFDWTRAAAAVDAMPDGTWTTYGDIAEFAGTSAIAVGQWVQSSRSPQKAYRVLGANGRPRPEFHWNDPSDTRDVRDVLAVEGVQFDRTGAAASDQRLGPSELASLAEPRM
jgi:alkylated DNA nucleotide flippase Atl1